MTSKHSWIYLLPLVALIMMLAIGATRAKTENEWVLARNGSQGYILSYPSNAIARRYDPEGILHIELPDYQVLTVRVHTNSAHLSAERWIDAWLSNHTVTSFTEVSEQVPVMPVVDRSYFNIEGISAETMILVGPGGPQRRTVFASDSNIYIIDYPLGHARNEDIFEQIVDSFETGEFVENSGFHEIRTDSTQVIAGLEVPYYSQKDAEWICDQLGTCNCNFNTCTTQTYTAIGDAGCFITSQAMIFQYYTGNSFKNPQEFDTCLTSNGGYGSWSGCAHGVCGASYSPPSACRPSSVTYVGYSTDLVLLDSDLNNGFPAIAWVDGGAHYVVVTGKSNGAYQINDPYYSRSEVTPGEIVHFVRYQGPVPASGTSWNFANGLQGWTVGKGLNNQQQLPEGMWFNVSANDPYLVGPMINVPAENYPYVYIEMASQTDNCGQLYFQRQGDEGFAEARSVSLPIVADGRDNYLIVDMTQNTYWTGNITRLRLDPACNAINSHALRIDKLALLSNAKSWNFANGLQGWTVGKGLNNQQQLPEGMWFNVSANDPYLVGPMINVPAENYPYVYIKMASQTDNCGQLYFQRREDAGFTQTGYISLPIVADGRDNRLIVDMTQNSQWTGDIIRLRLDPACQVVNSHAIRIDDVKFLPLTHRLFLPIVCK